MKGFKKKKKKAGKVEKRGKQQMQKNRNQIARYKYLYNLYI